MAALKLRIQTYQILTNDDEVCIPSLSSMYYLSCNATRKSKNMKCLPLYYLYSIPNIESCPLCSGAQGSSAHHLIASERLREVKVAFFR